MSGSAVSTRIQSVSSIKFKWTLLPFTCEGQLVQTLTKRGIRIELFKECLNLNR